MDPFHLPGFDHFSSSSSSLPIELPTSIGLHDDDDVYPVFALDGASWNRRYITRLMRFNDVLDAHMLHAALCGLLSIGDWRKLGGRFKLTDSGDLQIRVPKTFDSKRPAVRFTGISIGSNIDDHHLGRFLPNATVGVTLHDMPAELAALEARTDQPSSLGETYHTDEPQLSLHVINFNDATLVTWTFPHCTFDAFGSLDLLKNWSLVLAGRDAEVPPLLGTDSDALLAIEEACPTEEQEVWSMERLCMRGTRLGWMFARVIWDKVNLANFQRKFLYVPRAKIEHLVKLARDEVAQIGEKEARKVFVSEADVLTAFVARCVALSEPSTRPITVVGALNARFRFPQLLPKIGTYVQNMVAATFALFDKAALHGTLGATALCHREVVLAQSTKPQVLALLNQARQAIASNALPPIFVGPTDSTHVVVSNLIKLDILRAVDFSPAVVRQGEASSTRENPPGTPIFCYSNWRKSSISLIGCFYMLGCDWIGKGNYWFSGSLRPNAWRMIQQQLDEL